MTSSMPSFDVAQADRSPGMVLLHHLIDESIGRERRELSAAVGDEAFKRRLVNWARRAMIAVPRRFAPQQSLSTLMRSVRS